MRHTQSQNGTYAKFIEFDKKYNGLSAHKRLELYVKNYGTYYLDYYLARLSHEIYKSHGIKGHTVRQKIRTNLKKYALTIDDAQYSQLNHHTPNKISEKHLGCPMCHNANYKRRNGFHLFGINQYECNNCGTYFSKAI